MINPRGLYVVGADTSRLAGEFPHTAPPHYPRKYKTHKHQRVGAELSYFGLRIELGERLLCASLLIVTRTLMRAVFPRYCWRFCCASDVVWIAWKGMPSLTSLRGYTTLESSVSTKLESQ